MRPVLQIIPVLAATAAIVTVLTFPTPNDFGNYWEAEQATHEIVGGAVQTGPTQKFATKAGGETFGAVSALEENGCLSRLDTLQDDELSVCANLIALAVIEVAKFEQNTGSEIKTSERLILAATKVCRRKWASKPGLAVDIDDPACAASTLRLAMQINTE